MSDDTELFAMQIVGQASYANTESRRFQHRNIKPGTSECCPYSSNDCSRRGNKNMDVRIELSYTKNEGKTSGDIFYPIIPAGGYIVATGTFDQFKFERFDADHNLLHRPFLN
ncbi:hypothetical protein INT45_001091 [Circinella minor]|uniref:Uncharacterized protein n=1 Tax=Circinella minor TaxID=1195481 RepID=A0A8H7SCA6_9FUNG|nr:hypothetical protein INT45_001091 [Circinella minor]